MWQSIRHAGDLYLPRSWTATQFSHTERPLEVLCALLYYRYHIGNDNGANGLEIYFRTRKLQRTFNSDRNLSRAYGDRMARVIKMRLAVLRNAPTLSEVPTTPPERRHMLSGSRRGQYAIDLVHPFRMILEPNHDPVAREDEEASTGRVTSITILEIVDYH